MGVRKLSMISTTTAGKIHVSSAPDFSATDNHAAQFILKQNQTPPSIRDLASTLTHPFLSETDKARAIFTWLHYNIVYDAHAFFTGSISPSTPESTLRSGRAVCEGYAGLFLALAEKAGLQAYTISGHGKGYGYVALEPHAPTPSIDSNHSWNCVFVDEEWWLIDACWRAGYLEGTTYNQRFSPQWFMMTLSEFGRRHFPSDPQYQLLSPEESVSWPEYIGAPERPLFFGDLDKLAYHLDTIEPQTKYIQAGQRVTFRISKQCEHTYIHS
jgi:transglutaminase/protease-like cytokinesis protein 3